MFKQILVTGGAGFIGSHLIDFLINRTEAKIIVLDNLYRGSLEWLEAYIAKGRVQFFNDDINNVELLIKSMHGCDLVFHLAALSNVMGSNHNLEYSFKTNVVGTYNVLRTALAEGVKRIIFTSSREIYGQPDIIPVIESSPMHAKNAYGASKIAGEQYCVVFRDNFGLDVRILRLANVYGPRDTDRVIPLFCQLLQRRQPLIIYGGHQVIDFVWIGNVVDALWRTANVGEWPGPINVGSGKGIIVLKLAEMLRDEFNLNHTKFDIRSARSIEVSKFIADITRMNNYLSLVPDRLVLEHLPETVDFYKKSNGVRKVNYV